jgi:hypothetical protein
MWELWEGANSVDKAKIVEITKTIVGKTGTDGR